jgi:hypothetical protein
VCEFLGLLTSLVDHGVFTAVHLHPAPVRLVIIPVIANIRCS